MSKRTSLSFSGSPQLRDVKVFKFDNTWFAFYVDRNQDKIYAVNVNNPDSISLQSTLSFSNADPCEVFGFHTDDNGDLIFATGSFSTDKLHIIKFDLTNKALSLEQTIENDGDIDAPRHGTWVVDGSNDKGFVVTSQNADKVISLT